ncbi:pyruvate formate lyase activating enzyme [Eubacterium aggregans]|uniref:Pyruvate formate lyase activating enzyme n=1 Tax=Eubacterium aggregans TaxID=81409 RepID=A0A1H4DXJ4_9FIRM|nr:AmmeMemoRadiSam system radical SAM enzyme [Eubacterium aggregans]SEA77471.1 pyruvate formate lyase activating enzyme [Eubacterium aggregans]
MKTICPVCMHHCQLAEGQVGRCRGRQNQGGKILPINSGVITALALDAIEKKPLRHFYPGRLILSVGSFGCNLHCPFCQNARIAMAGRRDVEAMILSPEELARRAEGMRHQGNIGLAFTYNEPLIGYEFVVEAARLVQDRGMKTVLVTNGSATPEITRQVLPHIDALNIDLKGFTQEVYENLGGTLEVVKAFITQAVDAGCHVELTTLVVPGLNDDPGEMEAMARWIAHLSPDIPLHVTRFFPAHLMWRDDPTPLSTVYGLAEVARGSLNDVYEGNMGL